MSEVQLGGFDLNLLVALDALLEECSVTRAAARIGITQSAASHALARLRELTGDKLLVRTREGMVPTTRAEAMRGPLRHALAAIAKTLADPDAFDPKTARARIFIGASDYVEIVLLPGVMARLAREAPGVEVRLLTRAHAHAKELSTGRLDVAFAPTLPGPESQGIYAQELFRDRFVCVARRGHPLFRAKTLTPRAFAAAQHALVSPGGTEGGFVDDALERLGLRRSVTLATPHFLAGPHLVASSDLVLTIGERVASVVAKPLDLEIRNPPSELGLTGFGVTMWWHERTQSDPTRRWLRDVIVAEASRLSRPRKAITRSR
jgi:DNA-binding transcriptional LysR family regulator